MTAAPLRPLHFSQKAGPIGIACNSLESGFPVRKMDLDFLGFSRAKRAFSIGCEVPEEKERKIFSAPPPSSNARSGRVQRTLATEASGAHDGIVYRVLIFSKLLLQKLSKSENNQAAPGRVASNAGDKGSNR
jgi:hypothetical protein